MPLPLPDCARRACNELSLVYAHRLSKADALTCSSPEGLRSDTCLLRSSRRKWANGGGQQHLSPSSFFCHTSVHLLHLGGLVRGPLDLLQWREVVVVTEALVVIVDAEAQLDHAVDATRELRGLIQVEAGREQRGVEEQPDE